MCTNKSVYLTEVLQRLCQQIVSNVILTITVNLLSRIFIRCFKDSSRQILQKAHLRDDGITRSGGLAKPP